MKGGEKLLPTCVHSHVAKSTLTIRQRLTLLVPCSLRHRR